jgi:hypothetical protein
MNNKETFYIDYDVYFHKSKPLRDKRTIVKNSTGELHAQSKLQKYLKRKYGEDFKAMQVTKCEDSNTVGLRSQQKIMDMLRNFNIHH